MLAIILAARAERDSLIPYPLMEINDGQCLIDRTLTILLLFRALGMNYLSLMLMTMLRLCLIRITSSQLQWLHYQL